MLAVTVICRLEERLRDKESDPPRVTPVFIKDFSGVMVIALA